jgi:predicted transposase YdaD
MVENLYRLSSEGLGAIDQWYSEGREDGREDGREGGREEEKKWRKERGKGEKRRLKGGTKVGRLNGTTVLHFSWKLQKSIHSLPEASTVRTLWF